MEEGMFRVNMGEGYCRFAYNNYSNLISTLTGWLLVGLLVIIQLKGNTAQLNRPTETELGNICFVLLFYFPIKRVLMLVLKQNFTWVRCAKGYC